MPNGSQEVFKTGEIDQVKVKQVSSMKDAARFSSLDDNVISQVYQAFVKLTAEDKSA